MLVNGVLIKQGPDTASPKQRRFSYIDHFLSSDTWKPRWCTV